MHSFLNWSQPLKKCGNAPRFKGVLLKLVITSRGREGDEDCGRASRNWSYVTGRNSMMNFVRLPFAISQLRDPMRPVAAVAELGSLSIIERMAFLVCYSSSLDDHTRNTAIYLDQAFYELIFAHCASDPGRYAVLRKIALLRYKSPTIMIGE